MSVLMSKDKKELIVTCNCKCGQDYKTVKALVEIFDESEYDSFSIKLF